MGLATWLGWQAEDQDPGRLLQHGRDEGWQEFPSMISRQDHNDAKAVQAVTSFEGCDEDLGHIG